MARREYHHGERQRGETSIEEVMDGFQGLLEIDKNLAERTVKQHARNIEKFLISVDKPLAEIEKRDIRSWLREWKEDYAQSTYANKVKSLRVFFRDYLGSDIAENFSMPQPQPNNDSPPTKKKFRSFTR